MELGWDCMGQKTKALKPAADFNLTYIWYLQVCNIFLHTLKLSCIRNIGLYGAIRTKFKRIAVQIKEKGSL